MKILVDASAGRALAEFLASTEHDTVFSRDLGADPGDTELLKIAAGQSRIVVTVDRNFGRPVVLGEAPNTGIIFIPDVPFIQRKSLVLDAIERHEADLDTGAWVVARPGRIRIRRTAPPHPRSP